MRYKQMMLISLLTALSILLFSKWCHPNSSQQTAPSSSGAANSAADSGTHQERDGPQVVWEHLRFDNRIIPLTGEIDIGNRYLSTVLLVVETNSGGTKRCSGVIIDRSLVLTAGHCVCSGRRLVTSGGEHSILDTSVCADVATVETVFYISQGDSSYSGARRDVYTGAVRVHPHFKIVLDKQGQLMSSVADLAVVHLRRPLKEELHAVSLADTPVQIDESVVIAGYGYDEISNIYDDDRRFSRNRVLQFSQASAEVALVEQPGQHPYRADSGGPCLREGPTGVVLVGISTRSLGSGATFMSTHAYNGWIEDEIQFQRKASKLIPD